MSFLHNIQCGVMKISVIIPCRNDQQFLKECLQSVVDQTLSPASVVIIDDYSDKPINREDFPDSLGEFPIWLIRNEEKLGLAASRNIGVTLSGTPWFVPLDSDDLLYPEALAVFSAIALKSGARIVQGGVVCFGEGTAPYHDLTTPLPMDSTTARSQCPAHPTALINKIVWEKLGGYNEIGQASHRGYEDWDFWLRVIQYPERIVVEQTLTPVLKYRLREGSKLSTQEYDASRVEMIVRNRYLWGCHELACTAIRELRDYWKVQKIK